ncbi:MAG: M24 family metallopeptidase [Caldisericaceae bacterium]
MERFEKLGKKILENNIDAFFSASESNIRYITNFSGEEGYMLAFPDEITLIVDSRFTEQAKGEVFNNVKVVEYSGSLSDLIGSLLKQKKVHWLGVEKERISYNRFESLEAIPSVNIVPLSNFVEEFRMIKDSNELDFIRKACEISSKSFSEILPLIKEGVTEREIASELEYRFRKNGGEKPSFDTIVASGPRGALPHGVASDKPIKAHEPIVVDFGVFSKGYASDTTRMISIGEPSPEFKTCYEAVKESQKLGRDFARAGVKASDVDKKVRDYLKEKNLSFGHGLGHGVGLEIHELPFVNSSSPFTLEEGMVITIEPGLYFPDKFGMRLEDTVIVRQDGVEQLINLPHEVIIV